MRRAVTAVLLCLAGLAQAQPYPVKPIHFIVPFPPGGGNDTVARAIAQQLGPDLGQPVVIDNRPGAGGSVGAELAAKSPPDGYTLFLAGEVHLMFGIVVALVPHIQAGKLRALAVTSRKRSALLPEVPSLAESGLPDYEAGSWYGVMAPAGTPREIVERLHGAIARALKQPDVAKRLAAEGAIVIGSTPAEFGAHIKAELARVGNVVRGAGIRIE